MVERALIPVEERTPAAPEIAQPSPADRTAIRFGPFARIALQVGLVLGVGVLFRIELERGFAILAAVIFGGFLIHAWLPSHWRVPFFVLLTMTAIALLLGIDAVWLVALGLGLVGLCHLPIAWGARVVLTLVAAAGLIAVQAGWITAPWESEIIPILASMFMFRLILYLYDLKSERSPAGFWQRIAYFFLLPNVTFPLFPIVDYKNFLRNYYDAPAAEIYQKGTFWMLRGVTHLLLYRIVYHLLPLAESDLTGVVGVYAFMAMTFGLYLRISGIFHLIVGSLCLFGYNLPTTNHHYFLASGFSDLWRRANIYWRDFMMTVVFYPTFMMVRRWSMGTRLAFATAVVIVLTWFLHGYQWFWLRGAFPLTAPDLTFWGVLGLGLGINTLWENRRGRHRRLGRTEFSWKAALSITLRTIGFFTLMAFLFTMWNGGSMTDWWYRLLLVRESDAVDWAIFGSLLGAAILIGVMAQWLAARGWSLQRVEGMAWTRAPVYVPAAALALLLIGLPAVHDSIGGPVATVVGKAQSTKLNRIDREREERGYYETLSRATRFGAIPDRERDEELPDDWVGFRDSPAARRTGDLRGWEIVPGAVTAFKGVGFSANRWGMRDRDYTRDKPPGTYRLVLLGGSVDMGSGVEDGQTYENVLEDRLNREVAGRGSERYEILNFAVGGYGTLQSLYTLEHQVPSFDPDAVIVTIHPGDARRTADRLWSVLESGARGVEEYPDVMRILEQSEAHVGLPVDEFRRRVHPYRQELLRSSLRRMVASIRDQGAVPIFLFKSIPSRSFPRLELNRGIDFAREEGVVVIDITDVYEGYSLEELRIATWDNHPNPLGHRVIADRLYEELLERGDALGLSGSRKTASAGASP